jgi:hypothetical protein
MHAAACTFVPFVSFVVKIVRNPHSLAALVFGSQGRTRYDSFFNQYALNQQGVVLEVNPVLNQIKDLRGRSQALRGYL